MHVLKVTLLSVLVVGVAVIVGALGSPNTISASASTPPTNVQTFINSFLSYAQEQHGTYGVPVGVELAVGGLEGGCGTGAGPWPLSPQNNNWFNITYVAGDTWESGGYSCAGHNFRTYPSARAAWMDFGYFLTHDPNYTRFLGELNSPRQFLQDFYPTYCGGCNPSTVLSMYDNWTSQYDGGGTSSNLAIALIMDSSGSMSANDPSDLRKSGADVFVGQARDSDQIAVVDFSSDLPGGGDARVLFPLGARTGNPAPILSAIDQVGAFNMTNMRAGIEDACAELAKAPSGTKKAAVLLSDGAHNWPDPSTYADAHACLKDMGVPVYTLGLFPPGSSEQPVGEPLLQQIASDTGGKYELLTDPNELQLVYNEIARTVMNGNSVLNTSTHLAQGQTQTMAVGIPANQMQANFLGGWTGSTVDMTLVAPDGTVIGPDSTDPNVYHAKGLTYELYRVTNPAAGQWSMSLFGADLPQGGEDVTAQVFAVAGPTPTPVPTVHHRNTPTPEPTTRPTSVPTAQPTVAAPVPLPPAPTSQVLHAIAAPATGDGGSRDGNSPVWLWIVGAATLATGMGWLVRHRVRAR